MEERDYIIGELIVVFRRLIGSLYARPLSHDECEYYLVHLDEIEKKLNELDAAQSHE